VGVLKVLKKRENWIISGSQVGDLTSLPQMVTGTTVKKTLAIAEMTMLQNISSPESTFYEDREQKFELSYLFNIVKRRILYFAISFVVVLIAAFTIVKMQRPIFRAEGEILVESPAIPADLVHPTITEMADERFEVFKQRVLARDNLLAVMNKYDLFPNDRDSLPEYAQLALMRARIEIKPVALELQRPGNSAAAFMLAFNYEVPQVALSVTNELIGQILSQDSSRRTSAATETARFLEQEVKRLTDEHDAVVAQLEALKPRALDQGQAASEVAKSQLKSLADLEADLVQKSSVYSDEHPVVKSLKKKIAALKHVIAIGPETTSVPNGADKPDIGFQVLQQRRVNLETTLQDASHKLDAARLGESMERNQQAEHLQLIESPELPHKPVTASKLKLFAMALVGAGIFGAGVVFAVEMLDNSIRSSRELAPIMDRRLIVTIPYMTSPGEDDRKRRNLLFLFAAVIAISATAVAILALNGVSMDQSWMGNLSH
jgi:uncharacterized protein involved in exopolysaccharide biosynthesis